MKIVSIILLSFLSLPALASPETHKAKAEELYRVSDGTNVNKYLESKINDLARKMIKTGVPKEGVKEITEAARAFILKRVDAKALEEKTIKRFIKDFTEEELTELVQMLKNPAFQKLKAEGPELKKMWDKEMESVLTKETGEELIEELTPIIKKYKP